ncbi:hypothetical protein MNBD_ALPHA07-1536 [hydrothermal vent metagenome]|uniref:Uncharacterized protein n=1 Tax=hydrothermal vent metagenome TaxID=652676 RepID=A0A3B0SAC0_9ZZZZ
MIHRKFIALIAATSIAVTGLTAAPAQAKDDTAKIIAGVAALALIGVVVSQSNKSRNRNRTTRTQPYDNGGVYGGGGYRDDNSYNNGGYRRDDNYYDDDSYNRPQPRRTQRKVLPRSCKVQARTRNGRVPAYSGSCLNNNYRYANALPRQCSFRARTGRHGARRTVYSRDCLASRGYRPGNY